MRYKDIKNFRKASKKGYLDSKQIHLFAWATNFLSLCVYNKKHIYKNAFNLKFRADTSKKTPQVNQILLSANCKNWSHNLTYRMWKWVTWFSFKRESLFCLHYWVVSWCCYSLVRKKISCVTTSKFSGYTYQGAQYCYSLYKKLGHLKNLFLPVVVIQ